MKKTIHTRENGVFLRLLRRVRKNAGFTQEEFARKLELTQSHVSKIERGENRIDIMQLRTFCKVLGISLADFVAKLEADLTRAK